MTSYTNLFRNIQTGIASYQDIGTIYSKLETQSHLYKLSELIAEIFEEEHEFTINELKKYGKDTKGISDQFLFEQYDLNSGIFRRNLALIVMNIVEETGRFFLERFKKGQLLQNMNFKPENEELVEQQSDGRTLALDKFHHGTDLPEIREETENDRGSLNGSIQRTLPNEEVNKSLRESPEKFAKRPENRPLDQNSLQSRQYETEVHNFSNRINSAPNFHSVPVQVRHDNYTGQHFDPRQSQEKRNKPIQQEKSRYQNYASEAWDEQENIKEPHNYQDDGDQFMFQSVPGSHEGSGVKDSARQILSKVSSPSNDSDARRNKGSQRSLSGDSYAKMSLMKKGSTSTPKIPSQISNDRVSIKPGSPTKINSKNQVSASQSRYSNMPQNLQPDHSVLDSEFSYNKGVTFSKSQRRLHEQQDVPGPGYYKPEQGLHKIKAKSPTSLFGKSPKVSIFEKVQSESPGHIYYPTTHYISK